MEYYILRWHGMCTLVFERLFDTADTGSDDDGETKTGSITMATTMTIDRCENE